MRILHVITSLRTGGAETLVVNMVPRLWQLGHTVDVCVFNGCETPLMQRLQDECPECRIHRLGQSFYNPWHIVRLMRLMRCYDVVHTHNTSPQLFAAVANIVCRKKLVTTEHSTNNRKREHGGLLRLVDSWMYSRYSRIICISIRAEQKLREYLGSQFKGYHKDGTDNIVTIENGVDVDGFHRADPVGGLHGRRFVTVMVAGFREAKDHETLLRAMSLLPADDYELWLVGDGVRRPLLERLIAELGIADRVRLLGLRIDVPAVLKASDVVVMSSHWEGLSLSNIEGMSAGKPFIGSDVDGLREVTQGYGLLFPHGDAASLAALIRRLHGERDFYDKVADRCYERARQFDISKTVQEYGKLYEVCGSTS